LRRRHDPRVGRHDHERDEQSERRGDGDHPVLDEHASDLAHALEPALDVGRPPDLEIADGQAQQPLGEIVERAPVDRDGDAGERAPLHDRHRDRTQQREHDRAGHQRRRARPATAQQPVDHDLGQDRQRHLECRGDQGEHRGRRERAVVRTHEREQPAERQSAARRVRQAGRRRGDRRVTRPLRGDLVGAHRAQAQRRVGDPGPAVAQLVQDDPVVPAPVQDQRLRQRREPLGRGLDRAELDPDLGATAHDPAQARAVELGPDGRPDRGERYVVSEVPAERGDASGAAVHRVDLAHDGEPPAAASGRGGPEFPGVVLGDFGEQLLLARERRVPVRRGHGGSGAATARDERGAFVQPRPDLRVLGDEPAQVILGDVQHPGLAHRPQRRRVVVSSEHVTRVQPVGLLPLAIHRREPPARDEVEPGPAPA
jgi:hypothetical protein